MGAPGGGGAGLVGPGHGAEGPLRGKMNKGWLELESDPGTEGPRRAGGWGGLMGPGRTCMTNPSSCRPTQAFSPSWWKILVRIPLPPIVGPWLVCMRGWSFEFSLQNLGLLRRPLLS